MILKVTLLMLIFDGAQLLQVWEPDNRYESMDACKQAAEGYLAMPLKDPAHSAKALCMDPEAGTIFFGVQE